MKMKILMINKFLFPKGGSESYMLKLGDYLESQGHEVQYFGMEHEDRCVGNAVNSYTENMDFHGGNRLGKLTYPFKIIYSVDARKKIRRVLDDFEPDVCHLNNFNYQLTPSVILEIVKWRKEAGKKCRIIYTAHDYQLLCPNHLMNNPLTGENCEKCLDGHFFHCARGRCIHGSFARSLIGMAEAEFWKLRGVYWHVDTIICCSTFMKSKMDRNPVLAGRTIALHNFVEAIETEKCEKKEYVLYFGRYSREKGIETLVNVCRELPDIPFVFAGRGALEELIHTVDNITDVGFLQGEEIKKLIREARFTVYPSEWYENCPFSVMESQMYGTPVLGADIGGIPELIQNGKTGELFESRNREELKKRIQKLWDDRKQTEQYAENCREIRFDTLEMYYQKLIQIYLGDGTGEKKYEKA